MSELKRKMIIDCDTGTDDAVAVLALLLADNIDVIGITSVHGNLSVEEATRNNLSLVELLQKDVPVYQGCPHALTHGLFPGRTMNTLCQTIRKEYQGQPLRIHEPSLGLETGGRQPEREHAVSYLVRTLRETAEPIDVCAVGPLTNIAAALTMAPEIAGKIGTLYIMGGGIHTGNRTPVGEANFVDDAEAAAKVMLSGANILLGPIEANEAGATYGLKEIEAIEAWGTGRPPSWEPSCAASSGAAATSGSPDSTCLPMISTPTLPAASTTGRRWLRPSTPLSSPRPARRSAGWTAPAAWPTASSSLTAGAIMQRPTPPWSTIWTATAARPSCCPSWPKPTEPKPDLFHFLPLPPAKTALPTWATLSILYGCRGLSAAWRGGRPYRCGGWSRR